MRIRRLECSGKRKEAVRKKPDASILQAPSDACGHQLPLKGALWGIITRIKFKNLPL